MSPLRALALALPLALPPRALPSEADDPDAGGDWTLVWDDSLDDVLEDVRKQCRIRLTEVDGRVNGSFVGEVTGTPRNALFTGECVSSLVLLQQREPGYVCAYQLHVVEDRLEGTWADTSGGGGTAVMVRELADEERGAPGEGR